jgi:hypothetical protein
MQSMTHSFAKRSSVSPSIDFARPRATRVAAVRVGSVLALLAVSVWMGGLVALGALAAPVVFAIVALPASADAMTVVFRRFDMVAMGCAAVILATEAARAGLRLTSPRLDRARALVSLVAAAFAVFEGTRISPRIAQLHAEGVLRGLGPGGRELSRLHDLAETCGQLQLALLTLVIVLHVVTLSSSFATPRGAPASADRTATEP